MQRREFIGTLAGGVVAAAVPTSLLGAEKVHRIGYLGAGTRPFPWVDAFVKELEVRGYSEGRNLEIEWRFAKGQTELLPDLAADLVRRKVDVIVGATGYGALAAQQATKSIPIVVIGVHDGVRLGLYESLARPGGNVTGVDTLSEALIGKRIAMLKEFLPQLSSLAILFNPLYPGAEPNLAHVTEAAERLSIRTQLVKLPSVSDIEAGLDLIQKGSPEAVLVILDPILTALRPRVLEFVTEHRIPTIGEDKNWVQMGQLISYGATLEGIWSRGADYVAKILDGAKPADLPVEQPTVFELAINLKTAKSFGLKVPDGLVATANVIIE